MVTTRLYSHGTLKTEGFAVEEISDHIATDHCTVWADFLSPTTEDLDAIAEELGLHPLAVEDAVHSSQRAKLDRYDTHLFLAAYAVTLNSDTGELSTHEIKAFITPNALITVHGDDFDMTRVVARWDADRDLAVHLLRSRLLAEGKTLSEATATICLWLCWAHPEFNSRLIPLCFQS